MNDRWVENERFGVARIEPRLAMIDQLDRFLFIAAVMFASLGFFVIGAMPVQVLGGISATCFIGDALIALKNVVQSQIRPSATVIQFAPLKIR
jgi:hypothetical protein